MMKSLILLICTGNVCRSPMAAALLNAEADKRGDGELLQFESAGTWGANGQPASRHAQLAMARRGLSLDGHRAQSITPAAVDAASLILVMTRDHKYALSAEFPRARRKLRLISELVGLEYDISDPYGGPVEDYEVCANELNQLIARGYPRLREWLAAAESRMNAS